MSHATSISLDQVRANHANLFLLWDGDLPGPDRLAQIRTCLQLIQRHAPVAHVHLFSNVIQAEQLAFPGVRVVRWELERLFASSPVGERLPQPDDEWATWSDVFRVICLWRWGGSYLDVDDLLVRPLLAPENAMAACFLTEERAAQWMPRPTIAGVHAASTGVLPADVRFRFGADPMLNFGPENPFLEEWLRRIPGQPRDAWGQILPTSIYASDPDRWRATVNPVPWPDLLYHPYDGGHHPGDQRYRGDRWHSDALVGEDEFMTAWDCLLRAYRFPLVKNHDWRCQHRRGERQSLQHWAVQQAWASASRPREILAQRPTSAMAEKTPSMTPPRKLILRCLLPPGDLVVLSAAVRDLHRSHPGQFQTDVRTPHPDLWANNPHLTPLSDHDPDASPFDCHYPSIQQSNQRPRHFIEGFIEHLNQKLGLAIRLTEIRGDIHLTEQERTGPSPVEELKGYRGPFWLIASGGKRDFTIKWWDPHRHQQVVDHFRGRIQFVQVGAPGDFHPELDGAIDLRGRTDLRQLIRLVHHAEGVLCPVTSLMHLAAAVPSRNPQRLRPCVVVAGGREPAHWEAYPGHQFLHTIGMLPCCREGGCWRARTKPLRDGSHFNDERFLCVDVVDQLPRCMDLITAEDVIRKVEQFLAGEPRFPRRFTPVEPSTVAGPMPAAPSIHVAEARPNPRDLLLRHYSEVQALKKLPLREDLSQRALSNTPLGLGDTVILTQLPEVAAKHRQIRFIHSDSPHFLPLMRFNSHYRPADDKVRISADFLNARYDLGNGHFIQRLQRAFGLPVELRPRGHIELDHVPRKGRVALHFEPGRHSLWQRDHIHPRARELYPESRSVIQEFVQLHSQWSFVQVGGKPTPLEGVEDATGRPLELTLQLLSECEYFIGIVSGPMHVATALGVRCIVILNFPSAVEIMLPTLKSIARVESEWLYPQNVHLHQEDDGPLVKRLTLQNLERAVAGEVYPFWRDDHLSLIL